MDADSIAERMRIEEKILNHVLGAFDVALNAPINASTADDWLERFCFLTGSLSRHLRRFFTIEEEGGYADFIMRCQQPQLCRQAQTLQAEHRSLSRKLEAILADAITCSYRNCANLHSLRQRFGGFMMRLRKHHWDEQALWLEAHLVEIGGEG